MGMLNAALRYRQAGFSVIPVRPDKRPFVAWTEYQTRKATPEEIRTWFTKWPKAMIGIVTGEISGILVIDCDSEDAYQAIQKLLPESFITCIAKTPRGYHIYLAMPKDKSVGNATGIMPGVDVRGSGGYIIAPPSINGEGGRYCWLDGLSIFDEAPATVPPALYNIINNSTYKGCGHRVDTAEKIFSEGRRNEDLFTAALALTKQKLSEAFIRQAIENIAKNCKPPLPKEEVEAVLKSAFERGNKAERNLAADVREWVMSTNGHFLSTEVHRSLQVSTREELKNVSEILRRLIAEGIIERYGKKNGSFRRIDSEIEFMDFKNADIENTVDLTLPLGIHAKTKLFPKAVIVVAGVSGMGKTLFAFNTIAANMGRFPIYYFNSEMGPEALKQKLSHFPIPIEEWAKHMKVIDNWDFHNIADKIQPDALNVVDYLEPEGEKAFNIHGVISAIIRRLNKGVALITIQKKPGATMGTGGIYSVKAATLALALDWGKLEIAKNRFREADPMPSLNKIKFEVHRGFEFVRQGGWYR
ncbi:MAG: bifunctional DNA primase/polymerase [Syntrophales bacterium]|jgi:hypothetical protein|nr:bifunctional DNA primase/polymerase [Syntrophales bacterium]MCK9527212.1 bifunctional DNA primase/polymerase [Syntrophales bacterium]MDX9921318.1 bifunctional DNA primase/polymerase [Syntrophales bacterium]